MAREHRGIARRGGVAVGRFGVGVGVGVGVGGGFDRGTSFGIAGYARPDHLGDDRPVCDATSS